MDYTYFARSCQIANSQFQKMTFSEACENINMATTRLEPNRMSHLRAPVTSICHTIYFTSFSIQPRRRFSRGPAWSTLAPDATAKSAIQRVTSLPATSSNLSRIYSGTTRTPYQACLESLSNQLTGWFPKALLLGLALSPEIEVGWSIISMVSIYVSAIYVLIE